MANASEGHQRDKFIENSLCEVLFLLEVKSKHFEGPILKLMLQEKILINKTIKCEKGKDP